LIVNIEYPYFYLFYSLNEKKGGQTAALFFCCGFPHLVVLIKIFVICLTFSVLACKFVLVFSFGETGGSLKPASRATEAGCPSSF
jgi:hypothetical protein